MKKVLLIICLFCASLWAQQPTKPTPPTPTTPASPVPPTAPAVAPENAPKAVVAEDTFDAGIIVKGKKVEHAFIVKNAGKSDLEILSAKPG